MNASDKERLKNALMDLDCSIQNLITAIDEMGDEAAPTEVFDESLTKDDAEEEAVEVEPAEIVVEASEEAVEEAAEPEPEPVAPVEEPKPVSEKKPEPKKDDAVQAVTFDKFGNVVFKPSIKH